MKKIIYPILALSLFSTSCLKDEGYDNLSTGFSANNSDRFVTILNSNQVSGMRTMSIFTTPAEETLQPFVVSITGPLLNKDVNITIVLAPELVTAYNTEKGTHYEVLPAAGFELATTVTVAAGKEYVSVPLKLKKNALDPAKTYALGAKVTTTSDPSIKLPARSKEALIGIVIRNAYDGVYQLRGSAEHPTNPDLTGRVNATEWSLATNGATNVITSTSHPWASASGSTLPKANLTIFTIDPATNKVTVSDNVGAGFTNSPGYDSRYDPATKTIYAKWQYSGSGGNRVLTDTLVFLRPRD